MNSRRVFFTLLFAVVLGVGVAEAHGRQRPAVKGPPNPSLRVPRNGQWWISLSDDAKDDFVDGYMTAMTRASSTLANECADGIKRITPDGAPNAVIKQIWKLCEIGGSFDFEFEQRDLRSGLDDFYKDSQNTSLLIDIALQRVGNILRSKRPPVGGIGGAKTHQ